MVHLYISLVEAISVLLMITISVVLTFPESAAVTAVFGYGSGACDGAAGVKQTENNCRPSKTSIIEFTAGSFVDWTGLFLRPIRGRQQLPSTGL